MSLILYEKRNFVGTTMKFAPIAAPAVRALPTQKMSGTGLTVPGMTESPRRYDVTITVDRDGGHLPNPAEFAVAVEQAGSAIAASIVSAHTAGQIVSIVTVLAADQPAAVAVALAVVSDALRRPVVSPTR